MKHYRDPREQGLHSGRPMPPRRYAPVECDADGTAWCAGCDLPMGYVPNYRGERCGCGKRAKQQRST